MSAKSFDWHRAPLPGMPALKRWRTAQDTSRADFHRHKSTASRLQSSWTYFAPSWFYPPRILKSSTFFMKLRANCEMVWSLE